MSEPSILARRTAELGTLRRLQGRPGAGLRHRTSARAATEPQAIGVLREAADRALDADDPGFALDCLRLAVVALPDRGGRADIAGLRSDLVRATWRLDPEAARREVNTLLGTARAGGLRPEQALALTEYLSWYGRPDEAAQVLATAAQPGAELDPAWRGARASLARVYPGLLEPQLGQGPAVTASPTLETRSAMMIEGLLTSGLTDDVLGAARLIVRQAQLSDRGCEPILAAIETMVLAECLDEAAAWCDKLLGEAAGRRVPAWCARLASLRALISFRQGSLIEAEQHARAAVSEIGPESLGVFIGLPLSVLILTAIETGQHELALSQLSVPVPEAMFRSTCGLHYLRARGRFYLARGARELAAEEFRACGELMISWGLDLPGIVPWRTDLVQTNPDPAQARNLAREQLSLIGRHNIRTRGISLRVLAAVSELSHREPILREAIGVLRRGGDRRELAGALADLGDVQYALGAAVAARATVRRARRVADGTADDTDPWPETGGLAPPKLSDAELRVVSLAAGGDTNRQIAGKLFITVSTVEQHLTRVYRKLRITRRADLAQVLGPGAGHRDVATVGTGAGHG